MSKQPETINVIQDPSSWLASGLYSKYNSSVQPETV